MDTVSLETLIGYYQSSADSSYDARTNAERDRDFYDGKQWTSEEAAELKRRGQQAVVVNKVASKIDWMLGMERKLRADPRAFPNNPSSEEAAHAATDALRYAVESNQFDAIASDGAEHLFIEGIEVASVEVEPYGSEYDVCVKPVKWDRFFYDPHSRRRDFSDANYLGIVIWMDFDEAKSRWKKAADSLDQGMQDAGSTYDDKPNGTWYDSKRQRVMVVDIYFKHKSKWHHAIFTKGAFLEQPKASGYIDENGEPECALIAQSAKIDRDGNRYGAARQYIDIQREINARRAKFLHLLSVRQTKGEKGAVSDVNAMKRELSKPDGHVEVTPGMEFEVLQTGDMSAAQFQLYQAESMEIDSIGANPSLQGKQDGDHSGVALERREQAGLMEMGPFFDSHRTWKHRIYRAMWNRIRQFWTAEKWIRVTDDEQNLKWVGLNVPITGADQLAMQETGLPLSEARKEFGPQIEQAKMMEPSLAQQVRVDNAIQELDVDITLDESADMVTLQSEQFEQLVTLYSANPQGVPWEFIIEASSLRNKDKLLKSLRGDPAQAEQQAQEQAIVKQLMMEKEGAEIDLTQAKTKSELAKAQKTQTDAGVAVLEAMLLQARPDITPNVII